MRPHRPQRAASVKRQARTRYIAETRTSMGWLSSHKLEALDRIIAASMGNWAKKARRLSRTSRRVVRSLIHRP